MKMPLAQPVSTRAIQALGWRLPGQHCDVGDGEMETCELTGKGRETFQGMQDGSVVWNGFLRIVIPLQAKVEERL